MLNGLLLSWAKQEDLRLLYKQRCPEKPGWFLLLLPLLKWMGYMGWLKGPSRSQSPGSSSQGRKMETGQKDCNPTLVQYFFCACLWWVALMITAEGRILENDTLPCYQDTNNSNPFLPEGYLRISVHSHYTALHSHSWQTVHPYIHTQFIVHTIFLKSIAQETWVTYELPPAWTNNNMTDLSSAAVTVGAAWEVAMAASKKGTYIMNV